MRPRRRRRRRQAPRPRPKQGSYCAAPVGSQDRRMTWVRSKFAFDRLKRPRTRPCARAPIRKVASAVRFLTERERRHRHASPRRGRHERLGSSAVILPARPHVFSGLGPHLVPCSGNNSAKRLLISGNNCSLILQPHSFSHLKRPRRCSGFLRSSTGSVLSRNLAREPEASVSQNSREEYARPKKVGGLYSMCPREAGLCGNHTLVIFDKNDYHVRKGPCAFWRSTRPAARRQSRSWKAAGLSRSR